MWESLDQPMQEAQTPAAGAGADQGASERGEVLLAVSNEIVRLHKQCWGKGPSKARSNLSGNVLVVILEGVLTRAEETLLKHGHQREVARGRYAMQRSVEE